MADCLHDWEMHGEWGVIIGASRCRKCGRLARSEDFVRHDRDHDWRDE